MMSRSRQALNILILLWALITLPAGCAGLGESLNPPQMKISNIQVREIRPFEAVFEVRLRAFNTNEAVIDIKGIKCELEINGRRFATGVSNTRTEIPPYQTATIPIDVYSSVLDLIRGLPGLGEKKERLRYTLKGHVRVEGGFLVPSIIPFRFEGELSLKEISGSKE
jgi:LEA14-like dessication related protein